MRSAMTIFVCVSLLFAGAVAGHAQSTHAATLNGIVSTVDGSQPAGGIRVQLERGGITVQEKFSTDGRFQFGNVAPGSYTVVVESPDYETAKTSVEIPGEPFLSIRLRPVRRGDGGKAETRSLLMYLFEANRLNEAEQLGLKLHRTTKHGPEVHMVLVEIYLRQARHGEMLRELELFVKEAPPGRLREQARKILALADR